MTTALAKAIASAYDVMPHAPHQPDVAESYRVFIRETVEQFESISKQIHIVWTEEDPYSSSKAMFSDVENGVCRVFVGGNLPDDHPLADYPLNCSFGTPTLNAHFRAVHDILGHYATRSGFGPRGEETAWRAHREWYSPLARKAMTTETRGQNCWFQQHNTPGIEPKMYAPQKAGLLPDFCLQIGR